MHTQLYARHFHSVKPFGEGWPAWLHEAGCVIQKRDIPIHAKGAIYKSRLYEFTY